MVFSNNLLMGAGGQATGYDIEQSIRFNDDDSAFMDRTPSSAGNRKTWTWSGWVKRASNSEQAFFAAGDNSSDRFGIRFSSAANGAYLGVFDDISAGTSLDLQSEKNFVDFAAWYHIVVAVDTTQSTASNRCKVYVNGNQITDFNNADYMGQNTDTSVNNTVTHRIGRLSYNTAQKFDGYLAEINFIDGSQLAPANFGETSSTTGQWVPIKYAGSYGTNGFYIDGADSSFLGKDAKATSAAVTNKASTSSEWDGETGAYTFATNEIDRSSTVNSIISSDLLSGNFSFDFTMTSSGGALRVGVIDDQEYDTFNGTGDDGGMDSMTNSFYLDKGNDQFRYGGASQGSASGVANGSAVTIERTGSTIKITDDGSTAHTFSQTFSGPVRVVISGGGAAFNLDSVQYTADGASGNDNSFFSSGLAAADQVTDSPTDNFCTYNPLRVRGTNTLSDGNLQAAAGSTGAYVTSTFGVSSGKWYWEYSFTGTFNNAIVGVMDTTLYQDAFPSQLTRAALYYSSTGNKFIDSTQSSYGATYGVSDKVGVALNLDDNEITFYKNNSSQGAISITNREYTPLAGEEGSVNGGIIANFGQTGFAYTPPTGFSALSTANLPDPTVSDPADQFDIGLWAGNNTDGRAITGYNFGPDWVWIKARNNAYSHNLTDAVRGAGVYLQSSTNDAEVTGPGAFGSTLAFTSDGFTLDNGTTSNLYVNQTGTNYVGWAWNANGSGSSNTDGSINSTVSANTTSGFSIVSYSGNATSGATVGHGLGADVKMIMLKDRGVTENWCVFHEAMGPTKFVFLNTADGSFTNSNRWNNTSPTSSVFTLGNETQVNGSGRNYIAYCFAEVDGFSKFGGYEAMAQLMVLLSTQVLSPDG